MDISAFTDRQKMPASEELAVILGDSHRFWQQILLFVRNQYPGVLEEWNFPGAKYGWSFRLKDKKRAIIYLLPRQSYFKVAFVFGSKATERIMQSHVRNAIKVELAEARLYAEGRGIRIDVYNEDSLRDIEQLIVIKLHD